MSFLFYFCIFSFLILCVFLTFIILIQESKSAGLGAIFGSDPSDSLFGTSTAVVLKKFTAYLVAIFMFSCIILSLWTSSLGRRQEMPILPTIEEVE